MLQLPHVDMDVIKKLSRRRVRGLGDLLELPPEERLAALHGCGGPFPPSLSAAAHVVAQAQHWPGKTCGICTRSCLLSSAC